MELAFSAIPIVFVWICCRFDFARITHLASGCRDQYLNTGLMLKVVKVFASYELAAHQRLTHLSLREMQHASRSCPAAQPYLRAFCSADLAGDLLSACLPAVPSLPVAIITARTGPDCARRRTALPRAARAAAAAVGAGLAAGTARASCPPPASFAGAVEAAAPSPTPAVAKNQRFSGNFPRAPEMV